MLQELSGCMGGDDIHAPRGEAPWRVASMVAHCGILRVISLRERHL